ncbi:hypothetical protein K432DRAFT_409979 [Lepidopterella palustris CBS 459.81]|uniref:Uncharacterized protein n=1 Tax=Lepidopterella palustris CBS 459.81 TaxID=1314670 RepID=A0A8E2DZ74_9PEZI|nr:hypothetical protein K432DRAFT_409979 [Lepidopterella palustris CBS 459.81]
MGYSGSINSFYGMHEIFRSSKMLKSKRPVTFVTKSGCLPGYVSRTFILHDYDISTTILVAGSSANLLKEIGEVVTLEKTYEGIHPSANFFAYSSITLDVDEDNLYMTKFISNGTNILYIRAHKTHKRSGGRSMARFSYTRATFSQLYEAGW